MDQWRVSLVVNTPAISVPDGDIQHTSFAGLSGVTRVCPKVAIKAHSTGAVATGSTACREHALVP